MNVTLRFIADDLDPAAVTEALGLSPSSTGRRGDSIVATLSRGQVISRPAIASYWVLELQGRTPAKLRQALTLLLNKAPGPMVWKGLNTYAELTVHEAPSGSTPVGIFGSDTVEQLKSRGVTIVINEE